MRKNANLYKYLLSLAKMAGRGYKFASKLKEGEREEYEYYLEIDRVEDNDFNGHGVGFTGVSASDLNINKLAFTAEFVDYYATEISKLLAKKYPEISCLGVLLVHQTWDDSDEDGGDCQDYNWEEGFYMNGTDLWDCNNKLVDVDWDTDGLTYSEAGLPTIVGVPCDIEEDDIADWLSDNYGYCVNGWDYVNNEDNED